jgi:large subunit ribosomal protein L15
MMINDITASGPKRPVRFRVGRGPGSGNGKTCGRGQHGYYSRSGAPIRLGFQGGTMRFFRRLPRRGFNNKNFRLEWTEINVALLEKHFQAGETVDLKTAIERGLARNNAERIKILGWGELTKALKLDAAVNVSGPARIKIVAAGGSVAMPPPKKRPPPPQKAGAKAKAAAPEAEGDAKAAKAAKGAKGGKPEGAPKGERPPKAVRPDAGAAGEKKGGEAKAGGEKAAPKKKADKPDGGDSAGRPKK